MAAALTDQWETLADGGGEGAGGALAMASRKDLPEETLSILRTSQGKMHKAVQPTLNAKK